MRANLRTVLTVAVLGCTSIAQDRLYDVLWKVDEGGRLMMWPNPAEDPTPNYMAVFPPLLRGTRRFGWWGSMNSLWLLRTFLAPGPQDLASLSYRDYHFEKLGIGTAEDELRAFLASHTPDAPALRDRQALDRLLVVRFVQDERIVGLVPELREMVRNDSTEAFLGRAAEEALAALDDEEAPPWEGSPPPLEAVLQLMPGDSNLWFRIDQSGLPTLRSAQSAVKQMTTRALARRIESVGGPLNRSILSDAQGIADRDGEHPYELARLLGNWRVRRSLGAVAFDRGQGTRLWVRLDGEFQTSRIRIGLEEAGASVEGNDRRFVVTGLPGEHRLEVTSEYLVLSPAGHAPGGRDSAEHLVESGIAGDDALWIHLEDASGLAWSPHGLEWMQDLETATLEMSFEDGIRVRFRGGFRTDQLADRALGWFRALPGSIERDRMEAHPELGTLLEILSGLRVSADGRRLDAVCRADGIALEEILSWLLLLDL